MQRRIVSIAFYLNGIVLALLLVLQAAHGLFPSIQIQYWPVAISVVFLLSAFLWRGGSDGQGRVRESVWLRVTALAACLLSPFVCWYASLTSHGVPFIPVFNHLYLQVMGILALVFFLLLQAAYCWNIFLMFGRSPRAFLVCFIMRYLSTLIVILLMALAWGIVVMVMGVEPYGDEPLPVRFVPAVLWTIVQSKPCAISFAAIETLQLVSCAGVLGVLAYKASRRPNEQPGAEQPSGCDAPRADGARAGDDEVSTADVDVDVDTKEDKNENPTD